MIGTVELWTMRYTEEMWKGHGDNWRAHYVEGKSSGLSGRMSKSHGRAHYEASPQDSSGRMNRFPLVIPSRPRAIARFHSLLFHLTANGQSEIGDRKRVGKDRLPPGDCG